MTIYRNGKVPLLPPFETIRTIRIIGSSRTAKEKRRSESAATTCTAAAETSMCRRRQSKPGDILHLAAVYASDHTVTIYRNGKVLIPAFRNDPDDPNHRLVTYRKGEAALRIGGGVSIDIEDARLYARALSAAEIAMSYQTFKK